MSDNIEKQEYRVLARKYRPQIFADLIGQETLVQTLSNAISTNRIAHAYLLTGVRGVGWKEIEIYRQRGHKPTINLYNKAKNVAIKKTR